MIRMRTISETFKHIKEADPDTKLTYWAFRNMVITGRIPSNFAGRKYLINIDRLEEYFSNDAEREAEKLAQPEDYGIIRMQNWK